MHRLRRRAAHIGQWDPGRALDPRFKLLAPAAFGPAAMATGCGRVWMARIGVNHLVAGTDAEHEIYPPRPKKTENVRCLILWRAHV